MPRRPAGLEGLKGYKLALALRGEHTRTWVCQMTGIDPAYLCKIEKGRKTLGPKIALMLARLYRVNVDRLYRPEGF